MPFDLGRFQRLRPFLYHLTARENLCRIRRSRSLECSARLFDAAGRSELKRKHRRDGCRLKIGKEKVHIRDQSPLHERSIKLEGLFDEFIECLNGLVFFWPGTEEGPKPPGRRHFERYRNEHPVLVRIRTKELFEANGRYKPLFCCYNSGAPRWSRGKPSPRRPEIFSEAASAPFTAGKVVETVYSGWVVLPTDTEWGCSPNGPWKPLFSGR